jgi:DNA-directed RNA polymerase subunit E'/Rpb7
MSSKNIKKSVSKKQRIDNGIKDESENEQKNNNNKNELENEQRIEPKTEPRNELSGLTSSNLHNPYVNTTLVCPVMLLPNQMDNKLYIHLKSNLTNKLEGKCYKNYGFINKIYSIEDKSEGKIEAEDPSCSSKFIVKFTCNLCLPIVNKEIICKIDRMNKALISGINGPIKIIITADKINKDKFYPDANRNIRVKGTSQVIIPDIFIKVLILSRSFSDYDRNILVIGFLQEIATPEEINVYRTQNVDYGDSSRNIEQIED